MAGGALTTEDLAAFLIEGTQNTSASPLVHTPDGVSPEDRALRYGDSAAALPSLPCARHSTPRAAGPLASLRMASRLLPVALAVGLAYGQLKPPSNVTHRNGEKRR